MMTEKYLGSYDLVIIGAGMFGSAAARYASSFSDLKICLIGPKEPTVEEYKNRTIFASHYDEGRMTGGDDNDIYNTLCKKSIKNFEILEKCSGLQFYNPCGVLHMYQCTPDYFINVRNCRGDENEWLNISDPEVFSKKFPFMKLRENSEAFFYANGGYINPRKLIKAEQKMAQQQGCCIFSEVVTEVKEIIDDMHVVITETQKLLRARKILLCTGAFTNFNSLYSGNRLNFAVNKETYAMLQISEEEAFRLSSMPSMMIDHEVLPKQPKLHGAYILPPIKYPDGKYYLKIGHWGMIVDSELKSLEEIKKWYISKGDEYVINYYSKQLLELLPGLKVEDCQGKTCVTSASSNGMPFVDKIAPTVTVAAVGNGSGAAICDEIGRIAACLSIKGIWDSEISKTQFIMQYS